MIRIKKKKTVFRNHQEIPGTQNAFSLKRKWVLIVCLTFLMVLLPLIVMTLTDYKLTRRIIEDEIKQTMTTNVSTIAAALALLKKTNTPKVQIWNTIIPPSRPENDIFVVQDSKTLVSPSVYFGAPGSDIILPDLTAQSGFIKTTTLKGQKVLIAFARTPGKGLTIVQVKPEKELKELWLAPRVKLMAYLGLGILIILLSIIVMATYLVGRIRKANQHWLEALHHEEHATRLASIGRLASGVAHEINNPLAIINQKTGLILDLLTLGREDKKRLPALANDVLDAVKRCSTITRQLLNFARHMEPCIETVDIHEVLEQILPLIKEEAEQNRILIRVDHSMGVPSIQCDRSSLQQIFLNLAENAITAMVKGGALDISIRPETEKKMEIRICDTGTGIKDQDLNKIFEPFYSTKEEGWGAGLGLAITYGLIKEMGGDIRVKSRLNKGTQFTLTLPVKADPKPEQGGLHLPQNSKPGKENDL